VHIFLAHPVGLENAGPIDNRWKCATQKFRTENASLDTRMWNCIFSFYCHQYHGSHQV